jgi:hypothetical protein
LLVGFGSVCASAGAALATSDHNTSAAADGRRIGAAPERIGDSASALGEREYSRTVQGAQTSVTAVGGRADDGRYLMMSFRPRTRLMSPVTKARWCLPLAHTARVLTLAIVLWLSAAGHALAADALIISAPGYAYPATITNLTTLLTAASYTVTSVTAVPADLSPYSQVWDVRIDTGLVPRSCSIAERWRTRPRGHWLSSSTSTFSWAR